MTVVMVPAPTVPGIASGTIASVFQCASGSSSAETCSAGVSLSSSTVTMRIPYCSRMRPPAAWSIGTLMPRICSTKRPAHAHTSRMIRMAHALWLAIRAWITAVKRPAIDANNTAELIGLTMATSVVEKSTTSRRELLPVSNMTMRSMPMPIPPAGGRPCSSAWM